MGEARFHSWSAEYFTEKWRERRWRLFSTFPFGQFFCVIISYGGTLLEILLLFQEISCSVKGMDRYNIE